MPSDPPATLKLLLTAREAARALSISPRTLWSLTARRGPIPPGRRVLKALICKPQSRDRLVRMLGPEHFYQQQNAILLSHLIRMDHIDECLRAARLKEAGECEAAGGTVYLAEIMRPTGRPGAARLPWSIPRPAGRSAACRDRAPD